MNVGDERSISPWMEELPAIMAAFGVTVWHRGFTDEDRVLFHRQRGEAPTLPPPGTASP